MKNRLFKNKNGVAIFVATPLNREFFVLFFILLGFSATATIAAATPFLTATAIGTTDTFFTAFFRFDYIRYRPADNKRDGNDCNNFTDHFLFLLRLLFSFRSNNKEGKQADERQGNRPTDDRHPSRRKMRAREQRTEEVG